jgi:hypothetical protein
MNRGNGTKKTITPQQLGDVFEYCFVLVNVKCQIKYADDVFCKQRSDKANALGEINSKNRGII